jgi:hypothetical protein
MKLDKKEVVERRLKLMEQEGIKFECNADVAVMPWSRCARLRCDCCLYRRYLAARSAG